LISLNRLINFWHIQIRQRGQEVLRVLFVTGIVLCCRL